MTHFIGRKKEQESLKGLLKKNSASLVVLRGRRRIGKSRLAEEYAKLFPKSYLLSGIAPIEEVTADMQKAEFLRQLQEYQLPVYRCDDWGNLFFELAKVCQEGRVLIVLDEITWMGSKDPTFLPKLQSTWERHFKKNPELVLIISGSNSAWIEKNILSSTGFFGRVSLKIKLKELSLAECNAFWDAWPGSISSYEKFKILSVTGGVPRYLEEFRSDLSAEKNILKLGYNSEGILFTEFDQIFHDLFLKKEPFFKDIVSKLVDKNLKASSLAKALGRPSGGDLTEALKQLVESGFLARDYSWSIGQAKKLSRCRYRVRDNYLRFYLKYILPYKDQIEADQIEHLPSGWLSIMGLQFENLVVNNGAALRQCLEIKSDEVVFSNPYLQSKRTRRAGCQVDYLIQTRFNCLYVCEVKFSQGKIGREVIDEVKQKIAALEVPRGFSVRPVLIHVNGVDDSVIDAGFFARIIDFSELFCMTV